MHERIEHLIGPGGCRRDSGGWGYWTRGSNEDLSATQFALLALRAASRARYPVEAVRATVWTGALDFTRTLQADTGELRYTQDEKWSAGITAVGSLNTLRYFSCPLYPCTMA